MSDLADLKAKLIADVDDYVKDMKAAGEAAKGFGKAGETQAVGTKKSSDAIGAIGGQLAGFLTAGLFIKAGQEMLQFAGDSIKAASDVEEATSKFNVVFGDQADGVRTELEAMGDAINRSQYDLIGYAATFQDTFVPLGFARDAAADFSVALVGLAEDLASFNNLNTADVVRDLQSALVGNVETVRKYGVVASEAAIKQKALEMGLWDGKGAVEAQSKALAIYEILLDGTADAQGDAARTADSYANVSKGLEASILDLKVAVGDMLMPAMASAKEAATGFFGSFAGYITLYNELNQAVEAGNMGWLEAKAVQLEVAYGSKTAAEALAELAEQEAEINQLTQANTNTYTLYVRQAVQLAAVQGKIAEEDRGLYESMILAGEGGEAVLNIFGLMTEESWNMDRGMQAADERMFSMADNAMLLASQLSTTVTAVNEYAVEWGYADAAQQQFNASAEAGIQIQRRVAEEARQTSIIMAELVGATGDLDGSFSNNASLAANMLQEWDWAQAGGAELQAKLEEIGALQVEPEVKRDLLELAAVAAVELDVSLGNISEYEGALLLKDTLDLETLDEAKALLMNGENGILDNLQAMDDEIFQATAEIEDKTEAIREQMMSFVETWDGYHYATFVARYMEMGNPPAKKNKETVKNPDKPDYFGAEGGVGVVNNYYVYNELALKMTRQAMAAAELAAVDEVM